MLADDSCIQPKESKLASLREDATDRDPLTCNATRLSFPVRLSSHLAPRSEQCEPPVVPTHPAQGPDSRRAPP